MEELKTLKDFIERRVFDNGNDCEVVFPNELKQELGIKWIKFFEKERKEQATYRKTTLLSAVKGNYERERESHIELFKEVFNITDEDLK